LKDNNFIYGAFSAFSDCHAVLTAWYHNYSMLKKLICQTTVVLFIH